MTIPVEDPRRYDGSHCALCGLDLTGRQSVRSAFDARICADAVPCFNRRNTQ